MFNHIINSVTEALLPRSLLPFLFGTSSEAMSWVVRSHQITLHKLYPMPIYPYSGYFKPCSKNQASIQGISFVELKYIPMCPSTKASTLPPHSL